MFSDCGFCGFGEGVCVACVLVLSRLVECYYNCAFIGFRLHGDLLSADL